MRAMARRIPGCEFAVIEAAGHCAYFEKPREWSRLVIDFLRSRLARGPAI